MRKPGASSVPLRREILAKGCLYSVQPIMPHRLVRALVLVLVGFPLPGFRLRFGHRLRRGSVWRRGLGYWLGLDDRHRHNCLRGFNAAVRQRKRSALAAASQYADGQWNEDANARSLCDCPPNPPVPGMAAHHGCAPNLMVSGDGTRRPHIPVPEPASHHVSPSMASATLR